MEKMSPTKEDFVTYKGSKALSPPNPTIAVVVKEDYLD